MCAKFYSDNYGDTDYNVHESNFNYGDTDYNVHESNFKEKRTAS